MMKITAIVVIHNNPKHVEESLSSVVDEVDEIIIGDIGMTADLSEKIKRKVSRIIKLDPKIPFADLVKEDLKSQASGDYILYLDPDEIIPQKLWKIIKKEMKSYDYFLIPRKNLIFNKWIRYTRWWPDYQLRFFKKDQLTWPKELHPEPKAEGREFKVEAVEELAILHYNYDNINHYLEKAQRYAKFEADNYIRKNERLTFQQTVEKSVSEFISRFFAEQGYRDGMHGLVLSTIQMFYYFLVYFYYWELKKYDDSDSKNAVSGVHSFFTNILYETNYWMIKRNLVNWFVAIKLKISSIFLKT